MLTKEEEEKLIEALRECIMPAIQRAYQAGRDGAIREMREHLDRIVIR